MTVYAVNMTKDDTSAALQYGDVVHINMRYVYGDEIEDGCIPQPVHEALRQAAAQFDPKTDYLLIVGDHLQLVAFAALLGRWAGYTGADVESPQLRTFRVLRWDKKAEGYIPVWV